MFRHRFPEDAWLRDKFQKYQAATKFNTPLAPTYDQCDAEDLEIMRQIDSAVSELEEFQATKAEHKAKSR